jgi:hypothetical protein
VAYSASQALKFPLLAREGGRIVHIIQAIHSKKIFRPLFDDLRTWENWFVCLKAIFGLEMDRRERRIYRKFTGRTDRPSKPFPESFLIVGRRGGKSFISALTAVFLATFREWNLGLEKGYIMCIANDKKQAGVVLDYVRRILQLPIFRSMVVNETKEEIELSNRMVIAVHTCSYRSLRGYAICACVCDELAFWRAEGSNPAKEILTALRPSLGNIEGSLMLAISTGYSRTGPLWESYRDKYGQNDPQCLVWRAATTAMNPCYSEAVIRRALNDDYHASRSEYFGEFRTDLETFLPTELVESAVVSNRYELPPIQDIDYFAHTDPSGGRQDSFTLAVSHKDSSTGKIVLDCIREARPPFKPEEVVREFSEVLKSYGISQVVSDRYAGEWVSSAFRNHGIMAENSALSASQIYLNFLPLISNNSVELLDSKSLVSQLRGLERKTRSGGKDLVTHYPGGHDDVSNATAGSVVQAHREGEYLRSEISYGISEPVEGKQARMSREVQAWLLGKDTKRKQRPGEVDDEEIIREMEKLDSEIEAEIEQERQKSEATIKRWK